MTGPTARGCAGAVIALGTLAATLLAPRTLSDQAVAPPPPAMLPGGGCGLTSPCPPPGRDAWFDRVQAQLASRIPGLAERDRVRLALAILDEAERAALDPVFVLAIIEVESGYDPDALSDRGARGLMQLRPSTLLHEAERSRLVGTDPHDPVLNVRAGIRYFRRLLHVFRSEELALMAYNAGPNRISGYLKAGGIPERFRAYPQRVGAEVTRLRRALAIDAAAAVAQRDDEAVQ